MLSDIIADNIGKIVLIFIGLMIWGFIYIVKYAEDNDAREMEVCIERCGQSKHADRELCETLCSIQLKSSSHPVFIPLFINR
jgi:hypothetical protein